MLIGIWRRRGLSAPACYPTTLDPERPPSDGTGSRPGRVPQPVPVQQNLHTIKTKPIAEARLESHTEQEVKAWFQTYRDTLCEYKITRAKNVLNMMNQVLGLAVWEENML